MKLLLFHTSWNYSASSGSDTLPLFNVQYYIPRPWFSHSSDCSAMMSLVRISAIAAAVLRGLNYFAYRFSFLWLVFLDVLVDFSIWQWSSSEYKCWIGRSMWNFGVCSLTPCMTSSLPLCNSSTIPMLHFPLFFSSPLIKTTSPTSIFVAFVLWIILCLSRRDRK